MLGSARACKSRCVKLTPGWGTAGPWTPGTHMRPCHYLEILQVLPACWCVHHQELATLDQVLGLRDNTIRQHPFHRVLSLGLIMLGCWDLHGCTR